MSVKVKQWLWFFIIMIATIAATIILLSASIIDVETTENLGADFQYNILSSSSVIGGFLFTGISILISVLDKERIKRLWDCNYLDNLCRSAYAGLFANIFSFITAFCILCCNLSEKLLLIAIKVEIVLLAIGIVSFSWCVIRLIKTIKRLKPPKE